VDIAEEVYEENETMFKNICLLSTTVRRAEEINGVSVTLMMQFRFSCTS
jgi:hypothetical protein